MALKLSAFSAGRPLPQKDSFHFHFIFCVCRTLKIEGRFSAETLLTFYRTTRYQKPDDRNLHPHFLDKLKSSEMCGALFSLRHTSTWPNAKHVDSLNFFPLLACLLARLRIKIH
jgi:hypothetical protein